VLVLGSATCREAIFVRARLPEARIVCADFVDRRLPSIESALRIRFHQGDFHDLLERWQGEFDVVFSNHVLEHLFDPEHTLRLIRRALRPGGVLVSALPLDGQRGAPFSQMLNRKRLHALDMCAVDVAHAWKTNVSDLRRALSEAGFADLTFSGRDRFFAHAGKRFSSRASFERRRRQGMLLNRLLFASLRGVLKRLVPDDAPRLLTRVVFGLEQRLWFGSNRLKNAFSIECLLVAR
jgi:SAM-dependent methyltransferase